MKAIDLLALEYAVKTARRNAAIQNAVTRDDIQDPTGQRSNLPGRGFTRGFGIGPQYTAGNAFNGIAGCPINGEVGWAPGALFINPFSTAGGFIFYNVGTVTSATWQILDGTFGSGTALMLESGNMYRKVFAAGGPPASAGSAIIVDLFNIPANSFDGTGNRGITVSAGGSLVTTNATVTLNIGATAPAIGSAVSGGTTIATTGSMTGGSLAGWFLQAQVFKVGAKNANTQIYQEIATVFSTSHGGVGVPAALTLTENAAIPVCVTINVATTAANCLLWWWEVTGEN